MPKLTNDTSFSQTIGGTNYSFSGAGIDTLGATEYTLGVVVMDVSGSTSGFRAEMEKALKSIVQACRKNPRADNMMLRVVKFDDKVVEVHGFKPLQDCNENDYNGCLGVGGGTTALYDGCYTSVMSVMQYAEQLVAKDYDVNAAVFVVTDGCEYPAGNSTSTPRMVAEALQSGVKEEKVESVISVLIGLNTKGALAQQLDTVKTQCGFDRYLDIGDASPTKIAKVGDFISRSFSSQSQYLGTGGPSQPLGF